MEAILIIPITFRNLKLALELLTPVTQTYQSKSDKKKEDDQNEKNKTVDNRR